MTTPVDASAILEQLRSGALSPSALMAQQLDRLRAAQARLNACTAIFDEDALRQAAEPHSGPLAGLPVSVKETFGLAGASITAGSLRMQPIACSADAAVVARLRAAGAIISARSNVPEFAMTGETSNPRYGITANPLDPARVAGGSTGGEGALVGSGASLLGFGSDILGSIRIPAAFCGVVGFKPSAQAVDKSGTWPALHGETDNWLAIGPLARSVRDARLAYNVIARVPAPAPQPLAGLRLLTPQHFPYAVDAPCIQDALDSAQEALASAGLHPEAPHFPDVPQLFLKAADMILYDSEAAWKAQLSERAPFSVWAEALRQLAGRPSIDKGLFTWLLHGATLGMLTKPHSARAGQALAATLRQARQHYQALLGADGILVLPTLGMLAPRHGDMNRQTLRPGLNKRMTALTFCNYCDLPAIAIPAPRHRDPASGLIPSVMLACAPGAEGHLLDAAALVESALA
ncbi:amidase [Massilia sp. TS11]|uniref:amidase n=1 Tax=Massilia sp. TS11 TaxID=2908003 RepID=UPI001EDB3C1D|nr:amidase [Massilia sp. TS11]MCG2586868.1 amidase [Massilia sp. TS11]